MSGPLVGARWQSETPPPSLAELDLRAAVRFHKAGPYFRCVAARVVLLERVFIGSYPNHSLHKAGPSILSHRPCLFKSEDNSAPRDTSRLGLVSLPTAQKSAHTASETTVPAQLVAVPRASLLFSDL